MRGPKILRLMPAAQRAGDNVIQAGGQVRQGVRIAVHRVATYATQPAVALVDRQAALREYPRPLAARGAEQRAPVPGIVRRAHALRQSWPLAGAHSAGCRRLCIVRNAALGATRLCAPRLHIPAVHAGGSGCAPGLSARKAARRVRGGGAPIHRGSAHRARHRPVATPRLPRSVRTGATQAPVAHKVNGALSAYALPPGTLTHSHS